MNILLVRPDYPDCKNKKGRLIHYKYFPIGLLKMSTYFKMQGHNVELIMGNGESSRIPDKIFITSLFTYWRKYLVGTIEHYRVLYPESEIVVGGVDASLNERDIEKLGVKVHTGRMHEVDLLKPDYSYMDKTIDFQVLHTTYSCIRKCGPCGAHIIDGPEFIYKTVDQVEAEIFMNNLLLYDNSAAANPYFKDICRMLATKKVNGKVIKRVEAQSGFDARLLVKDYEETIKSGGDLSQSMFGLIKAARFINPRIAWDNWLEEEATVAKAIDLFEQAGYKRKNLQVFVLYNYNLTFQQMEYKRRRCAEMGVQMADCRYRPLDSVYDNYDPRKKQTCEDYYIHPNWTDEEVKTYRKRVRGQNIILRFMANNRPIRLDKFRKCNVPEVILEQFCSKYRWQENPDDIVHEPLAAYM